MADIPIDELLVVTVVSFNTAQSRREVIGNNNQTNDKAHGVSNIKLTAHRSIVCICDRFSRATLAANRRLQGRPLGMPRVHSSPLVMIGTVLANIPDSHKTSLDK